MFNFGLENVENICFKSLPQNKLSGPLCNVYRLNTAMVNYLMVFIKKDWLKTSNNIVKRRNLLPNGSSVICRLLTCI